VSEVEEHIKVIREWANYHTVSLERLRAAMTYYLDFFAEQETSLPAPEKSQPCVHGLDYEHYIDPDEDRRICSGTPGADAAPHEGEASA
jgi:hypothetical protein